MAASEMLTWWEGLAPDEQKMILAEWPWVRSLIPEAFPLIPAHHRGETPAEGLWAWHSGDETEEIGISEEFADFLRTQVEKHFREGVESADA